VEIIAILLVASFFVLESTVFHAKDRAEDTPLKIEIPQDSTASDIARVLYENNIIDNTSSFILSAKVLGLSSNLLAGDYYFAPSMSNLNILLHLKKGMYGTGGIKITVPEGSSIYRIAKNLQIKGLDPQGGFLRLLNQGITGERLAKYPFLKEVKTRSLEGYLFPDTYFISGTTSEEALVNMMLDRFSEVVFPVWLSSGAEKYDLYQVITMASIIEKEAENDVERPIIASVFYNRLETGIALRADPTVKYSIPNPTKRVTYSDLKYPSPYNTYLHPGLPLGPICNPGLKSILAAIHPAKTKYLYFVSNGDGTHTFSENWAGHKIAVRKFRKTQKTK
jgi:UPF0755 protein